MPRERKQNTDLLCPECGGPNQRVVDSRPVDGVVRRKRSCPDCDFVWHTVEVREELYRGQKVVLSGERRRIITALTDAQVAIREALQLLGRKS